MEILEVNLFPFAYRLFHEDFSPIYEAYNIVFNSLLNVPYFVNQDNCTEESIQRTVRAVGYMYKCNTPYTCCVVAICTDVPGLAALMMDEPAACASCWPAIPCSDAPGLSARVVEVPVKGGNENTVRLSILISTEIGLFGLNIFYWSGQKD